MEIAAVVAFAVVLTLVLVLRRRGSSRGEDFRIEDREAWGKKWAELEALLEHSDSHWQVAIIEADKLLDRVLKSMRLPGDTMGERLKFLTYSRTELKFVWQAHLVRNRLAHEANFRLDRRTARETMATFKRAFKLLGVL